MSEELGKWERDTITKLLETNVREHRAARRWGIFFKLFIVAYIVFVTMVMMDDKKTQVATEVSGKPFSAVVNISGEISAGSEANADTLNPLMRKAFDSSAKAVILRINSPGGSPLQARRLYSEMKRLRELHPEKKLYAVIEEAGASGAYWAACGADEIYADKTSIVGSIGVMLGSFGVVDSMQKLGVERRLFIAGDNKDMLDPFSPMRPGQAAILQQDIAKVHDMFIDLVKTSRGDRLKPSADMFSGRWWLGVDAMELGLIDGFGDVSSVARDIVGAPELVVYAPKKSFLSALTAKLGMATQAFLLDNKLS